MHYQVYLFALIATLFFLSSGNIEAQSRLNKSHLKADSLLSVSKKFTHNNPTEAKKLAERGLELTPINSKLRVQLISQVAYCYELSNQYKSALNEYKKGVAVAENLNLFQEQVKLYRYIGILHKNQNNLSLAKNYVRFAVDLAKKIGDIKQLAIGLNNLGVIYFHLNIADSALACYHESIRLREHINFYHQIGKVYQNLSNLLSKSIEDYPKALLYVDSAFKYYNAQGNQNGLFAILNLKANLHLLEGDTILYSQTVKQSAEFEHLVTNRKAIADAHHNLANWYFQTGTYTKAIEQVEIALETTSASQDKHGLAQAWLLKADIYLAASNLALCKQALDTGLNLIAALEAPQLYFNAQVIQANYYQKAGHFEKAYMAAMAAVERQGQYLTADKAQTIAQQTQSFELREYEYQLERMAQEKATLQAEAQAARLDSDLTLLKAGGLGLFVMVVVALLFVYGLMQVRTIRSQQYAQQLAAHASKQEAVRIGQDVHDLLGATLSDGILHLSNVVHDNRYLPSLSAEALNVAETRMRQAMDLVRKLSKRLIKDPVGELGFAEALNEAAKSCKIPTQVTFIGHISMLNPYQTHQVYRIIHQLLTNCEKHSRATKINVVLKELNRHFSFSVADDGVGIEAPEQTLQRGTGWQVITSRVQELDGELKVETNENGTRVLVQLGALGPAKSKFWNPFLHRRKK